MQTRYICRNLLRFILRILYFQQQNSTLQKIKFHVRYIQQSGILYNEYTYINIHILIQPG